MCAAGAQISGYCQFLASHISPNFSARALINLLAKKGHTWSKAPPAMVNYDV